MRVTSSLLFFVLLGGLAGASFAQTSKIQPSPHVVAKTNQTAGVPEKILYTPQNDGLFRVRIYLVLSSNDTRVIPESGLPSLLPTMSRRHSKPTSLGIRTRPAAMMVMSPKKTIFSTAYKTRVCSSVDAASVLWALEKPCK